MKLVDVNVNCLIVLRVVERGCYTEKDASAAVRELCEAVAVRLLCSGHTILINMAIAGQYMALCINWQFIL